VADAVRNIQHFSRIPSGSGFLLPFADIPIAQKSGSLEFLSQRDIDKKEMGEMQTLV
jgi:hypothetical protein